MSSIGNLNEKNWELSARIYALQCRIRTRHSTRKQGDLLALISREGLDNLQRPTVFLGLHLRRGSVPASASGESLTFSMTASCSSSDQFSYHAFLSFRGETRKGFSGHLYWALEQAGIHTFRDDEEVERTANTEAELQKGIRESQVSVVVFSKNYGSSRWCLDELARIMERTRTEGHKVLPVFYDVEPTNVRHQTGSFGEAFASRIKRSSEEKVEEWTNALRDAVDLGGMVLADRYEYKFIQDIVEEIGNRLNCTAMNVPDPAVGIKDHVNSLGVWLQDGSSDVDVAVIWGMGGIGKTTIAKAAYNLTFHGFPRSCFLTDVTSATSPDSPQSVHRFVCLHKKFLFDIPKEIYSMDEGINKIQCAVRGRKVLIVFDGLNDLDQFNAILGMRESFYPGSKIIITTRLHENISKARDQVSAMFKVEGLDSHASHELFCWHAFKQDYHVQGYECYIVSVVEHCGGNPLALQVLGSSLFGKTLEAWKSAVQNLSLITGDPIIQSILKISFSSLSDHDKRLFLHIAFFFIGKDMNFTATILDSCDFSTRFGIQNLVDKCLVEFGLDDKLFMHPLLRDMGMEIIRKESPEDPGKRSRVWQRDAFNILRKLTGTKTIKGLKLNPSSRESSDFSRQIWHNILSSEPMNTSSTSHSSDEPAFKAEAFRKMHNLEFLLLDNVKINGDYGDFPKNLVWLSWRGFPLESIPANFCLEYLVALELQNSRLRHVWEGTKFFLRLKILNLSGSHGLETTPELSAFPNLERLILEDCIKLVKIRARGHLKKLKFVNLSGSRSLETIPEFFAFVDLRH